MDISNQFPKIQMTPSHRKRNVAIAVLVILGIIVIIYAWFMATAPAGFVPGTVVVIPSGSSTRDAGKLLQENHIVRSGRYFEFIVKIMNDRSIVAGQFAFDHSESAYRVARTVTRGVFGSAQVKITIPEGSSVSDIAAIVQKQIPSFDAATFILHAKPMEGFLFPETYFVFKTITPDELITRLHTEYESKIALLSSDIAASKKSETQIIIMASILEKEAKNAPDASMVAGILWKRLSAGSALQVDAPFYYALNKSSSSKITAKELATDGPYNTYTRKGLPAGPIGNPGIAMITAALHPVSSPYWYYLYGKDGMIHYATTYAEHVANIKMYLR